VDSNIVKGMTDPLQPMIPDEEIGQVFSEYLAPAGLSQRQAFSNPQKLDFFSSDEDNDWDDSVVEGFGGGARGSGYSVAPASGYGVAPASGYGERLAAPLSSSVNKDRLRYKREEAEEAKEMPRFFYQDSGERLQEPTKPKTKPREDNRHMRALDRLVQMQNFDGAWNANEDFVEFFAPNIKTVDDLLASCPELKGNKGAADIWATAVAIAVLESKFDDEKGEWQMLVTKATKWMRTHCKEAALAMADIMAKARTLVADWKVNTDKKQ